MADYQYTLDIISATYGTNVVTERARKYYIEFAEFHPNYNFWNITPTDQIFGPGPAPHYAKHFVVVWRVITGKAIDDSQAFTRPSTWTCSQDTQGRLSYALEVQPYVPPANPLNGIYLLSATWWNLDVTAKVQGFINGSQSSPVTFKVDESTFGAPVPNPKKQLTVTYGLQLPDGRYQYNCKTAGQQSSPLTMQLPWGPAPPRLMILSANYGGIDFTSNVTDLVAFDQTLSLQFDSPYPNWPDPWPENQHKTISILYQFEGRGLELWVAKASGQYPNVIDPGAPLLPSRTWYLNSGSRNAGETNVLAVVWGIMQNNNGPVKREIFSSIKELAYFTPTIDYFGFDGYVGYNKVALVFFQYGITGAIQCASARYYEPTTALTPRSLSFQDPYPARGLLTNFSPEIMKGLRFKSTTSNKYLALNMAVNPPILDISNEKSSFGAIFNLVWTDEVIPRPRLSVTSPGISTTYYLNGLRTTVGIIDASEFHYEIPGISAGASIVLSYSTGHTKNNPTVLAALDSDTVAVIPVNSYQARSGADTFQKCSWQVEWVSAKPLDVSETPIDSQIGPCLYADAQILWDFCWSLPHLLAGSSPYLSGGNKRTVALWIAAIQDTSKKIILFKLLASLQAAVINMAKKAVQFKNLKVSLPLAMFTIAGLYQANMLWDLLGFIAHRFSWIDWGLMVANWTITIAEAVGTFNAAPALFFATSAVLWAAETANDIWGWLKVCVPEIIDAKAREGLVALLSSISKITSASTAFSQLITGKQLAVHQALLSPHWDRIYLGGPVAAPDEHRHEALQKLRDEAMLPESDTLRHFLRYEYTLDVESRELVEQLRPGVEDELDKVTTETRDSS